MKEPNENYQGYLSKIFQKEINIHNTTTLLKDKTEVISLKDLFLKLKEIKIVRATNYKYSKTGGASYDFTVKDSSTMYHLSLNVSPSTGYISMITFKPTNPNNISSQLRKILQPDNIS